MVSDFAVLMLEKPVELFDRQWSHNEVKKSMRSLGLRFTLSNYIKWYKKMSMEYEKKKKAGLAYKQLSLFDL